MQDDKKISMAVVRRLPRYYRYLSDLLDKDILRISSKELSEKMQITASQIRQDLNNFGCFGQQGYGYNVENLYNEIRKILGLDKIYKMIIIGTGNVGQALINYENFIFNGFQFVSLFDSNENLIGKKINELEILDIKNLKNFLDENEIDIAVLTLPKNKAHEVAKICEEGNVKGIWNFSNFELQDLIKLEIENVRLTDSLMTLSYKLNEIN